MSALSANESLELASDSPEQTRRLGACLGALLEGGAVICLEGPLGSGKTCFAQGIGRGFGVTQPLISPTFVLVREYARPGGGLKLYHVDLYRVSGPAETISLGVEEWLGDAHAVFVIEWAERMRELVPVDHLWIRLDFAGSNAGGERRLLNFTARGRQHIDLLRKFRDAAAEI